MAESWQLLLTGSGPFTRPGRVGRRSVSSLRVLLIQLHLWARGRPLTRTLVLLNCSKLMAIREATCIMRFNRPMPPSEEELVEIEISSLIRQQ